MLPSSKNYKSKDIKKIIADFKKYPFPYRPENYSRQEKLILQNFFTNVDKPIFAIFNLPDEIVGAMFSRYSRSNKSVRRLFLDEFWNSDDLGLKKSNLFKQSEDDLNKARDRTANFYKRVFAEYGDDSVIQMGSVHIAFEFVSQIAAKAIEDIRIGASFIEKSTRYVNFGEKVNGNYLYTLPPEIFNSKYEEEYKQLNDFLFDSYNKNLQLVTEYLKEKYPIEKQITEDSGRENVYRYENIKNNNYLDNLQKAYERSIKAKAFDTIRVFLPASTITNIGAHFSGQAAETVINKLLSSEYEEVRIIGILALQELIKVIPNFLQNVDHPFGELARNYRFKLRRMSQEISKDILIIKDHKDNYDVKLIQWDKDADIKIASQILYKGSEFNYSKSKILKWLKNIKRKEAKKTKNRKWSPTCIKIILDSIPGRNGFNRRQKLPRAFEHVFAEVDFNVNFGIYRDLQRHRMCTTERQFLSVESYYIPREFKDKKLKSVYENYLSALEKVKRLNLKLKNNTKFKVSSEYVTLFGNNLRFNIKANLRQWVFLCELRTIPGGHPSYRKIIQSVASQIINKLPFMKSLFTHVDWKKDYGLGRLRAEVTTQKKLLGIKSTKKIYI